MENPKMSEREKKIFQTGLFDNLTVQDAFTIIVLYAANLDLEDSLKDLDEIILSLLSKDSLFEEDKSHTLDRINKFAISMKEVNPLNAIERAAKVLTPELRQKSFLLAVQICKASQEIRMRRILESLASKLTIENEIVEKAMDSIHKKG
jgi:hypothetical protein